MTDPHTACAEDATIVIGDETRMRSIDGQEWMYVGHLDMVYAELLRQRLQLAMSVGDTDGTGMVALAEFHLKDKLSVLGEAVGIHRDLHALLHLGNAGRHEFIAALDLDETHSTGSYVAEPGEAAESGDEDAVLLGYFKDGLARGTAHLAILDGQRKDLNTDCRAHAATSSSALAG
jgi:hypothetical protein